MKVALVHDWLVTYAGSERVVEQILACYPQADVFAVVNFLPEAQKGFLGGRPVKTTFIQKLPFAKTKFRAYLPLMPLAIEQLDLSSYDLVISSSHAVAKGVLTGPDQLHVCMCYSPIRYAWDLQHQYLQETGLARGIKSMLTRWMLHKIRLWDVRTANGVDHFIAISHYIGRRIEKAYRRSSTVIYPPVDTEAFALVEQKEDFYLAASRLVPYKKLPLIVQAFNQMPERHLVLIGDGPDMARCRELAGSNVTIMGYQPNEVLKAHMQRAKAFVFAAEEDFGITPIEAQACGTPVIAYGRGAATETLRGLHDSSPTAEFFPEQSVASIVRAVDRFETVSVQAITPQACRQNALRFAPERFQSELKAFVEAALLQFNASRSAE